MATYVEIGANDGVIEMNVPKELDADNKVILIEANPVSYEKCCQNRPDAMVFNYACVADSSNGFVEFYASLDPESNQSGKDHLATIGPSGSQEIVSVPARMMQEVLEEAEVDSVEFMSLDVEGAEAQILRGVDDDMIIEKLLVEVHHPNSFGQIQDPDTDEEIIAEAERLGMVVTQRQIIAPPNPGFTGKGREYIYFVRRVA